MLSLMGAGEAISISIEGRQDKVSLVRLDKSATDRYRYQRICEEGPTGTAARKASRETWITTGKCKSVDIHSARGVPTSHCPPCYLFVVEQTKAA